MILRVHGALLMAFSIIYTFRTPMAWIYITSGARYVSAAFFAVRVGGVDHVKESSVNGTVESGSVVFVQTPVG